jgi:hypothetical protein
MLDVPWWPDVHDFSKSLLSASAALKCHWKVSQVFWSGVLARHSRVAASNHPVAAMML